MRVRDSMQDKKMGIKELSFLNPLLGHFYGIQFVNCNRYTSKEKMKTASKSAAAPAAPVVPSAIDDLVKSLAFEFSIPIVRGDHVHATTPLTVEEIETYFRNFTAYVKKLKNQIHAENAQREEENQIATRAKQLEGDLRYALMAAEDVKALRAKASHLVECIRIEKDRVAAETAKVEKYAQHVAILEDHIEKVNKLNTF